MEVLVADVAAPHDRELRVRGEGLVVHAAVQALEVGDVAEGLEAAVRVWVVETNLDVGMRVEHGDDRVQPLDAVVVDQQPHAHAALGGVPELLEQQEPGDVGVPDVVLHVEGALRRARERDPGGEGVPSLRERVDAALALPVGVRRPHRLTETRVRRFGEGRRRGSRLQRGERGASARNQRDKKKRGLRRDQEGGRRRPVKPPSARPRMGEPTNGHQGAPLFTRRRAEPNPPRGKSLG